MTAAKADSQWEAGWLAAVPRLAVRLAGLRVPGSCCCCCWSLLFLFIFFPSLLLFLSSFLSSPFPLRVRFYNSWREVRDGLRLGASLLRAAPKAVWFVKPPPPTTDPIEAELCGALRVLHFWLNRDGVANRCAARERGGARFICFGKPIPGGGVRAE